MDKEGIMIYLCMKGQNEWLEEVKAYFQKTYKDTFGIIQMNQNFIGKMNFL